MLEHVALPHTLAFGFDVETLDYCPVSDNHQVEAAYLPPASEQINVELQW